MSDSTPRRRPASRTAMKASTPILGAEQAGTLLGYSRDETYYRLERGTFPVPTRKAGRRWEIFRADVERVVQGGSTGAAISTPAASLPAAALDSRGLAELLPLVLSGELDLEITIHVRRAQRSPGQEESHAR